MSTYADILKKKQKEWGCEDLLTSSSTTIIKKIPFSSPMMNWFTHGGIPRNKITEFFGDPGAGKSSSSIDICKNAYKIFKEEYEQKVAELQRRIEGGDKKAKSELADLKDRGQKRVLYIDLEHSFDMYWSNVLGIKQDEIDVIQPPNVTAEDILQTIQELVESDEVGLIVLDSIVSLVPQKELEKKFGEATVASLAGLLNVFFRKIVPMLTRHETTLLYINQTRANLANPYVVNTPGGNAPKFYASLRILFTLGTPVDFLGNELPQKAENPAGYIITAKIIKQKSGSNDRKLGSYYLMCDSGIRPDFDYAQLAIKKYNIIRKGGAWFTLYDPETGEEIENDEGDAVKLNGLARVYEYLEANPEYMRKIQNYILNDINSSHQGQELTYDDEE